MNNMMYKFRVWLARMMAGRYGNDRFNQFLLIAGVVLLITLGRVHGWWFNIPGWLLIGWSLFRFFSRNIPRRRQENATYINITTQVISIFRSRRREHQDKTHVYFYCPKCNCRLRIPKGRGRLFVTCTRCGHKFERKS